MSQDKFKLFEHLFCRHLTHFYVYVITEFVNCFCTNCASYMVRNFLSIVIASGLITQVYLRGIVQQVQATARPWAE
jgi:hypothetical protein